MKQFKRLVLAALACGIAMQTSQPLHGASGSPTLTTLQSELQRNFQGLKKEAVPPYFLSYTVHDTKDNDHARRVRRAAAQRRRASAPRVVEVRVGDYALDNTHPMRGDSNGAPRVGLTTLPLTDDDKPTRVALWRATDRSFKQATESLTRVKTNVAAKIKDDNPAPDFSHEAPQTYSGPAASYSLDTKAWEARLRRLSAPFAEDPLIFDSDVSLTVESDNRTT